MRKTGKHSVTKAQPLSSHEMEAIQRDPLSEEGKAARKKLRMIIVNDDIVWKELQREMRKLDVYTNCCLAEFLNRGMLEKALVASETPAGQLSNSTGISVRRSGKTEVSMDSNCTVRGDNEEFVSTLQKLFKLCSAPVSRSCPNQRTRHTTDSVEASHILQDRRTVYARRRTDQSFNLLSYSKRNTWDVKLRSNAINERHTDSPQEIRNSSGPLYTHIEKPYQSLGDISSLQKSFALKFDGPSLDNPHPSENPRSDLPRDPRLRAVLNHAVTASQDISHAEAPVPELISKVLVSNDAISENHLFEDFPSRKLPLKSLVEENGNGSNGGVVSAQAKKVHRRNRNDASCSKFTRPDQLARGSEIIFDHFLDERRSKTRPDCKDEKQDNCQGERAP